ncbi:MAG: hypothetical protein JO189_10060 [Deltaproteobacteria bacterium]|nr:hypothetical protein [Deltaproteobacteria bacterium]
MIAEPRFGRENRHGSTTGIAQIEVNSTTSLVSAVPENSLGGQEVLTASGRNQAGSWTALLNRLELRGAEIPGVRPGSG